MSTPADSPIYDSETLVRRVIDMIATARTIPLSSSPVINRDEVLELLEEAVDRLPEELRRARWMLKERDEFIAKTRRQAEDILDEARAHAERMVQRTEVVRAAELRARRMKLEVEDFCDRRLGSFEIVLDRLQKTVAAGREKLNLGARVEQEDEEPEDNGNPAFFDQDRL
jgi:cell division septum initiation protein DivIVA